MIRIKTSMIELYIILLKDDFSHDIEELNSWYTY